MYEDKKVICRIDCNLIIISFQLKSLTLVLMFTIFIFFIIHRYEQNQEKPGTSWQHLKG